MRYLLIAVAGTLCVGGESLAQDGSSGTAIFAPSPLAFHKQFNLQIRDEVSGGCWTNVDAVRSRVRYLLENASFPVHLESSSDFPSMFNPSLDIRVSGFRNNDVCVGSMIMSVNYAALSEYNKALPNEMVVLLVAQSYERVNTMVYNNSLNDPILANISSHTEGLISDIIERRRERYFLEWERLSAVPDG